MDKRLVVTGRDEWRQWLADNHGRADEIWLVYFKKHTGKPGIGYAESVEEAICFGWIDGLKKSIDDETYAHRFSPRRPGSKWTPLNIRRARAMIEQGLMKEAGLKSFKQRTEYEDEFLELRNQRELDVPAELKEAWQANGEAWQNFKALAPGYKKQYILWITTAKKPETRQKRLAEATRLLAENRKPGMK